MKNKDFKFETLASFVPKKQSLNNGAVNKNNIKNQNNFKGNFLERESTNDTVSHSGLRSQYGAESKNITVFAPETLEDLNNAISLLKNEEAVILDLTYKKPELINKVLGYLSGAVVALNGSIKNLIDNIYIITPNNLNIKCE